MGLFTKKRSRLVIIKAFISTDQPIVKQAGGGVNEIPSIEIVRETLYSIQMISSPLSEDEMIKQAIEFLTEKYKIIIISHQVVHSITI